MYFEIRWIYRLQLYFVCNFFKNKLSYYSVQRADVHYNTTYFYTKILPIRNNIWIIPIDYYKKCINTMIDRTLVRKKKIDLLVLERFIVSSSCLHETIDFYGVDTIQLWNLLSLALNASKLLLWSELHIERVILVVMPLQMYLPLSQYLWLQKHSKRQHDICTMTACD